MKKRLGYAIGIILIMIAIANAQLTELPDLYHSLDTDYISGSIVIDEANLTNGTITNEAFAITDGLLNEAYGFDSTDDSISLGSPTNVNTALDADYSWFFWVNKSSLSGNEWVWRWQGTGYHQSYFDGTYLRFHSADGTDWCTIRTTASYSTVNQWVSVALVKNSSESNCASGLLSIYLDGTEVAFTVADQGGDNKPNRAITWSTSYYGADHSSANALGGSMDEFAFWKDYALTQEDIDYLHNSGSGQNPFRSVGGGGDTDPPVFSNYVQDPSNATVYNVVGGVTMNVTVTDASTVTEVNLTHSTINVFVNGSIYDTNPIHTALFNASNIYQFQIREVDFLSGTYNYDPIAMEETVHSSYTLTGLNRFLSFEFLNFTNQSQVNFVEVMDENSTGNAEFSQYYYCNDDYDFSSSVTGSSDCTLFASVLNTLGFNHSHGQSKHRILSLGADTSTGQIGNVEITKTSYIVKRGTQFGDDVYYISNPSRTDAFKVTTNGGNTWTAQNDRSYDVHIHQVTSDTKLNYSYVACDSEGNCATSVEQSDIIEYGDLPPNAVQIYRPISDVTYNLSFIINHSTSNYPSGASFQNYTYEYKRSTDVEYTFLDSSNVENTVTYTWDISALLDGAYTLKITVFDDNELSESTLVNFIIDNPPTTAEAITEGFATLSLTIEEVFTLIAIVSLYGILMFLGYWMIRSSNYWSGIPLIISTVGFDMYFAVLWNNTTNYLGMLFLAIALLKIFSFVVVRGNKTYN